MLFGAQSSLKTLQAHAHARALATVDLAVIMSITKRCWLMARTCTLEHAVRDRGREWRTLKIDAHDRGLAIDTQKRYRAMVHHHFTIHERAARQTPPQRFGVFGVLFFVRISRQRKRASCSRVCVCMYKHIRVS